MIPTPYKILGAMLILLALVIAAEYDGGNRVQARWDKAKAAQAIADANKAATQATETVKVVTKYVNRTIHTKDTSNALQDRVSSLADNCRLSAGWGLLHDASAANIPATPADINGAGEGVAANTAIATIIQNYGSCHENAARLTALQDWVIRMGAAE